MPQSNLVSVITPCFNKAGFLPQAIDSVLGQSYSPVEMIIVDDGSTDATEQVATGYGDRVRFIKQSNQGPSAARNAGLALARGQFVLFLDADDWIARDAIERLITAVQSEGADVACASWNETSGEGAVIRVKPAPELPSDLFHHWLKRNIAVCHSLLLRRSVFDTAGAWDVRLGWHEDWDLWLRVAAAGFRFVRAPDAIVYYRRYAGSWSGNFDRMCQGAVGMYRKVRTYHGQCDICEAILPELIQKWRRKRFDRLVRSAVNSPTIGARVRWTWKGTTTLMADGPGQAAAFIAAVSMASARKLVRHIQKRF